MFKLATLLVLLLPGTVFAQNIDPAKLEQMKQQLKSMQSCIQKTDKAEMKKIGQQAKALDVEIKALCTAGKRDAAQQKAITFGKQTAASPAMEEMKKCGEQVTAMLPSLLSEMSDGEENHVCDR